MTDGQWYWDGYGWRWAAAPQPTPAQAAYVSGLSTGGHLAHGLLTLCTLGLWAPIWFLSYWLGRRRIR